ncbi:transposase [Streptomyces ureilyticus]|uniref:transposase n=1 Tax=Streptomyces ureilyticus TaxID=1775131 RepID=UPI002E297F23|nr:transposase [Streptomyces ureilyticus]
MSERKPYKTDVSDEQWALVEPVITAWKAAHPSASGHQGRFAMPEIVNGLLYEGRTGCQWDLLPHDFPPPGVVNYRRSPSSRVRIRDPPAVLRAPTAVVDRCYRSVGRGEARSCSSQIPVSRYWRVGIFASVGVPAPWPRLYRTARGTKRPGRPIALRAAPQC